MGVAMPASNNILTVTFTVNAVAAATALFAAFGVGALVATKLSVHSREEICEDTLQEEEVPPIKRCTRSTAKEEQISPISGDDEPVSEESKPIAEDVPSESDRLLPVFAEQLHGDELSNSAESSKSTNEKECNKVRAGAAFKPDLSETERYNRQHCNNRGPVTERLYKCNNMDNEVVKILTCEEKNSAKDVPSFYPDLSPTANYRKHHPTLDKQKPVSERLYKDALHNEFVTRHTCKEKDSQKDLPSFHPDLSQTADYRKRHPSLNQQKPVADRLFEDALHRQEEKRRA